VYHVVGGGIAGLAAAYRLRDHGHEVRVLEAGDDLGGLAATYETGGDPVERFYHHLSRSEETVVELAEALGLGDAVEWRVGKNAYYVDGVVHPLDTPTQILAYPHMSLYDKLRLGLLTAGVDVRGGWPRLDTYDDLRAFEDVGVEEFVVEHTTRGVYDQFVEPLLDAKFGERTDDVSAAWFLGRVRFRGERDLLRGEVLGYIDGGFGRLLDRLVEAVGRDRVETGTRVTDVGTAGGRVESVTVDDGTGERTVASDGVVVATMPNVLETLTGHECDVDFQGALCAVVTLSESVTDTYWLNVAHDAPFGALIEHTNFVPPERYGGDRLLYVASYVQRLDDPLWLASDDEVRETWLAEVASMFPEFDRSTVESFRLARAPRAAPVYERGYLDLVVPYDLADEVAEGVYYAGMASPAQYPERSLDGGVVAGYECADRIAARAEGREGERRAAPGADD
jgi:protoporphyrinogen oxidase